MAICVQGTGQNVEKLFSLIAPTIVEMAAWVNYRIGRRAIYPESFLSIESPVIM